MGATADTPESDFNQRTRQAFRYWVQKSVRFVRVAAGSACTLLETHVINNNTQVGRQSKVLVKDVVI